jgi:acetyltransferase-like isoleucine patch superfamily enzyme
MHFIYYKIKKKSLFIHQKTIIRGVENIHTKRLLKIGISYCGFLHEKDITVLNIQGKLNINGSVSIGRGCRFDIGENALIEIGNNSYINPFSLFIIQHGLYIGENCAISWNCQFLDEDFHTMEYEKKELPDNKIIIADHVWIGSNVSIYKGAFIGKNSIVASNSEVKDKFLEENVLIAGNPARIVKKNIRW